MGTTYTGQPASRTSPSWNAVNSLKNLLMQTVWHGLQLCAKEVTQMVPDTHVPRAWRRTHWVPCPAGCCQQVRRQEGAGSPMRAARASWQSAQAMLPYPALWGTPVALWLLESPDWSRMLCIAMQPLHARNYSVIEGTHREAWVHLKLFHMECLTA